MRTRWNNWSFGIHFLCRVSAQRCEAFFEPQALAAVRSFLTPAIKALSQPTLVARKKGMRKIASP